MADDLVLIALARISEQLGDIRDLLAKMPAPRITVSDPLAEYQVSKMRRADIEHEQRERTRRKITTTVGCR